MTLLIKDILDPFNILWMMVFAGIMCALLKKKAVMRGIFIGAGLWFLVISTPFLPTLLLNSLERQYEPVLAGQLSDSATSYHIIVLGGGHGFDDRLPANSLLSSTALSRLSEGIRIHLQIPNSTLILSGYSSSGRTTQAEMLKDTALLLGVEEGNTLVQTEPGNTLEEAQVYAEKYSGDNQVILVTSAVHMPRAVMLFERVGINVIPSPANYHLKGSWRHVWIGLPSIKNIEKLRTAIHEYAAILKYKFV